MGKYKYEKYVIEKGKTDLKSSLKKVNEKLINKYLKENGLDDIEEMMEDIIGKFEITLSMCKDDYFTKLFFQRLVENENSPIFSAYESDVESFIVFVCENNGFYSYYIPDEIRKIIKKELKI